MDKPLNTPTKPGKYVFKNDAPNGVTMLVEVIENPVKDLFVQFTGNPSPTPVSILKGKWLPLPEDF